ncbi:MAG: 3-oxoacyl-[Oscillospiraceae bacterium]|nr:3-oxoacyl-[acyl-carrier-protein] reductase [Oscillospiraceae bacterium]MBR3556925.1 3-oxoacyl-[acyl-carrier-protein] reductase [Oscillospiraceae bacterium]
MLKGKVAVVTGGSRGIGAAIAVKLASLGADLALIYAGNGAKAEAVAESCRALGVRAETYLCDVADGEAVKAAVGKIKAELGGVQLLVNNAGITRDGLVAAMKEEDFDAVLDTNLKGAFHMIRYCSGLMLRARYGRIVNISSVAGLMGNPGQANYAAAKAGLIGLTKTAAKELASRGITVNAVAPGLIDTDMTRSLGLAEDALRAAIPLGRAGKAEEVAEAVAFLLQADYITGAVLRVDGGMAM